MSTSTTQAAVDQFLRKHQLFSFAKHKPLRIGTTFVKPPDMTDAQFAAIRLQFPIKSNAMPPQMIGRGVYTLAEVNRLTQVAPRTVRDWFKWRSDKGGQGPLFESDYERIGEDYAVSFLNLIEVYAASFFYKHGVKTPIIRRAHEILQEELHTPHPFAHEDLSTDGSGIIREKGGHDIDVVAKQILIPEFKARLDRLSYDKATRLADLWRIAPGVIVSPRLGFGKPVIEHTGISTFIVAKQYEANKENAALVARLYNVTPEAVKSASQFERSLRIAA